MQMYVIILANFHINGRKTYTSGTEENYKPGPDLLKVR